MNQPIRIAIVGAGYGYKVALPVYQEMAEFEPVALWSRRPERADELAQRAGIRVTSDVDELLATPGLEAVHIATPVTTHAPLAIAAAEQGLHVLCEKPLASSLHDARRIAGAIDAAGVLGAVNYGRRLQQIRERVLRLANDVVGHPRMATISMVHTDHAEPDSRSFGWVHDAGYGGGRLQAYGVHDIDLLLRLFPEVEAVTAATDIAVPRRPTPTSTPTSTARVTAEDGYTLLIRFRGGGLGVISLVATAHHGRADVIELYGDEGTVRVDAERRIWWAGQGEEPRCEGPLEASSTDAFTRVARNFHSAIRHGTAPDPSLHEGLAVQAVLDAVRTADAERRWVAPEPVDPVPGPATNQHRPRSATGEGR